MIDGFHAGEYVDASCHWQLEHDTMGDSNVTKKNALSYTVRAGGLIHHRYLNFARDGGEVLMWNYYGDPDLWEFMEYHRIGGPDV